MSFRKEHELRFVRTALKNIKYTDELLSTLDDDIQLAIIQEMRVQSQPKGKCVFEAGEFLLSLIYISHTQLGCVGRHFYMLLKGSVYILGRSAVKKVEQREIARAHKRTGTRSPQKKTEPVFTDFPSQPQTKPNSPLLKTNPSSPPKDAGDESNNSLTMPSIQLERAITMPSDSQEAKSAGNVVRKSSKSPTKLSPSHSPTMKKQQSEQKELILKVLDANEAFVVKETFQVRRINDPSILTEQQIRTQYSDHTLLATLRAPNFFGEIALNTQQPR